jgi:WD40 repeat protein
MRLSSYLSRALSVFLLASSFGTALLAAGQDAKPSTKVPSYLIANDDRTPKAPMSGTFFSFQSDGLPQNPVRVDLGGVGSGGGYFATNRVSVLKSATSACAYLALGGSGEISAVDIPSMQAIGDFPASASDSGFDNGIGLANNGSYVYAIFTTSNTIATFAVMPGCGLQYLSSIASSGLHGGDLTGMAVHDNFLVVTYGDGSIQSYNVAAGTPVSNNDLQDATGYKTDRFPVGVDITKDGHYVIFGDASNTTTVEVSDASSGKLTRTIMYTVGPAFNSNSVLLSPDESLLYIVNTTYGHVTAAFFDKTTGQVKPGCVSPKLKGFDDQWAYLSSPVTRLATGTGSQLYVSEFGAPSAIAVINVTINVTSGAGTCTLEEAPGSPVVDPNSITMLSIGVYPARPF